MNNKISLSYTTMSGLLNAPHTYLNKVNKLPTFQTTEMKEGDTAHGIIQRHISGVESHKALEEKGLPTFALVEREKWDEQMRVRFDINDTYYFTGFLDGDDPERLDLLEIKSGAVWSLGKFARLPQWKLYAIGRPDYKKMWFLNLPRNPLEWNEDSIKIFNMDITAKHRLEGWDFINEALFVIKNIGDKVDEEMREKKAKGLIGRSRYCFYIDCQFCSSDRESNYAYEAF